MRGTLGYRRTGAPPCGRKVHLALWAIILAQPMPAWSQAWTPEAETSEKVQHSSLPEQKGDAAQPLPDPVTAPPFGLSGDWGGIRAKLLDRGISITASYGGEVAHNAQGGHRSAVTTANQAVLGAAFDLERLGIIDGGQAHITITQRHGENLGDAAGFPQIMLVQEVYGRGNIVRLTEMWWSQRLTSDLSLKIGRMPVNDFGTFGCDFMNLGLCGAQMPNTANDYVLAWPISQWGVVATFGSDKHLYLRVGAYQITQHNLDQDHPVELGDFGHASGALLPLEFGISPAFGRAQLKGTYKFGGWYDTSEANDVFLNQDRQPLVLDGGLPLRRSGRYGAYVAMEQEIAKIGGDAGRSVGIFAGGTIADRRTAPIDYQLRAGLLVTGPFANRKSDKIGVGISVSHRNERIARGEALVDPATVQHSETAIEIFYSLTVLNFLKLQPSLQYVIDPGGIKRGSDLVILGLKFGITL